jgi:HAE1 family hydrophobic/amphiphilic exporter-1
VVSFALASPRPPKELRRIADDVIKDRLGKLKGVGSVSVVGGDIREILVSVDKDALEGYGLTISDVVQALQATNLNLPSGSIREGRREYAVRAVGEFQSPDEVRDVRLVTRRGNSIFLSDVAEVSDTVAERTSLARVDSVDSVAVTVLKQSDANTVQVADGVRNELMALTGQTFDEEGKEVKGAPRRAGVLPPDITARITRDQSTFIREALHDLQKSLMLGSLFAVLVVFLFLHNLRGTFIVALAIPTSIIATFTPMFFSGFTLNMMTMLGLSLTVGILVDDSIVVIENIYRHLRLGERPREAAFSGRTEIGLAAITITLVDVVVFVPIAFMGGIVGQFFRQFGLTVAMATLFSLFVSFTLTPMLSSRWFREAEALPDEEGRSARQAGASLFSRVLGAFFAALDRVYGAFRARYRRVLAWALDHRLVTVMIGIVALLACTAIAIPRPSLAEVTKALPKAGMAMAKAAAAAVAVGAALFLLATAVVLIARLLRLLRTVRIRRIAYPAVIVAGVLVVVGICGGLVFAGLPKLAVGALVLVLTLAATALGGKGGRLPMLAVGVVALLVALFAVKPLGFEMFPQVDQGQVTVGVELPAGSSLAATDGIVKRLEDYLLDRKRNPEVESVLSTVGSDGASNAGIAVTLVDKALRKRSDTKFADAVAQYARTVPGANIKASAYAGMGGGGRSPVSIELSGSNMDELVRIADRIKSRIAQLPGIVNADTTWKVGKPELRALIDRNRAADRGVSTYQVASALRASLEGDTNSKYREGSNQYDIRVRLNQADRQSVDQVANLVVGFGSGAVYLGDIAEVSLSTGPTKIDRKNRQRMVAVTADIGVGHTAGNVEQDIRKAIKGVPLGTVSMNFGGESEIRGESFGNLGQALGLAVILIYVLQAALFEGYLSPFIIMFALPMALVGALLAMVITGKSLSIITMIGIIMLMGLVGKNAILMVDYTNTLRARGMERREALLEAAPIRLRPILMTTLAMVCGMLPIALATARGGEIRAPMAITVIGGLIVSSMLTLLVIPVLYTVFDGVAASFARLMRRVLERI